MGVDSVTKSYDGWIIDVNKLVQYMKDTLGVTDQEFEDSGIITSIDDSKLPEGWYITNSSPEYDLEEEECIFYLCVDPHYEGNNRVPHERVKSLAKLLGSQGDAKVITAVSWY